MAKAMGCGCETTLARNALISASEAPTNIAGIVAKGAVVLAGTCWATAAAGDRNGFSVNACMALMSSGAI